MGMEMEEAPADVMTPTKHFSSDSHMCRNELSVYLFSFDLPYFSFDSFANSVGQVTV